MSRMRRKTWRGSMLVFALTAYAASANTFTVVNSGASDYVINGVNDPALTLYRGRTYTFNINASGHPFWIKTSAVTGTASAYSDGVTGNGTQVGTLTFTVPTNAPATLFYICQFHGTMTGALNIENSPQRGWWRFEAAGTNVLDLSGWGLHAVTEEGLNSGPDDGISGFSVDVPGALIVDGNLTNANNGSLRFTKGLGQVHILDPSRFAITNTEGRLTIEAFIKVTSANLPMRIINIAKTTNPAPTTLISPFLSDLGPAPYPSFSIHSDSNTMFFTSFPSAIQPSPIAYRHWHHIAFVQDGVFSRFYVDYQPAGQWNGTGEFVPAPFTGVNEITLGGIAGQVHNTFEGLIDEIRVTDRALAPAQFLRVANGLAPGIRAMPSAEEPSALTVVTESNSTYRVQGATNLPATPQVWTHVGGVFSGRAFYTTVTNAGAPAPYSRVIRNP